MTVGFVEEVIKDNSHYKTSYEKREEASSVYASANRRLNDTSDSLNRSVDALNEKIRNLNGRKRELLNGMKCGVSVMPCKLPTSYTVSSYSDSFNGLLDKSDPLSMCIRISR